MKWLILSQVQVKALLNHSDSCHIFFFPFNYMGRTKSFVVQIFLPWMSNLLSFSPFCRKMRFIWIWCWTLSPRLCTGWLGTSTRPRPPSPLSMLRWDEHTHTRVCFFVFLYSHPGSAGMKRLILVPQQGHGFVIIRFLSLIETCCLCWSRFPIWEKHR